MLIYTSITTWTISLPDLCAGPLPWNPLAAAKSARPGKQQIFQCC